jgi:DNA-directed RNA polymerase subunit RPC12/RpoP
MGGRRIQAYTATGRMDGACPYCQRDLPEWPTRSIPCPHCGNEMLVRTRPLDRERVLVTEADAEMLEMQWELLRERGGASPLRPLLDDEELEAERASLRIRFGREPSQEDVAASLISHRSFEHMRRLELGGYRDFMLAKASLLDQQGKEAEALAGYLGVCFLDLNGARNPPSPGPGGVADRVFHRPRLPGAAGDRADPASDRHRRPGRGRGARRLHRLLRAAVPDPARAAQAARDLAAAGRRPVQPGLIQTSPSGRSLRGTGDAFILYGVNLSRYAG